MSRFLHLPSPEELPEEDPLAGIANLFDVSVVFIVGLMITLFSVYRMADLVDANSEVTMVKTNAQGEREIIVKKGTKITAYKVSGKTATGDGERLGTAYRLANGQIIYVPEGPDESASLAAACFPTHRGTGAPRTKRTLLPGSGLCSWLDQRTHRLLDPGPPDPAARSPEPGADSHRLRLLRRQPARHVEGLQVAAAGAARPPGPRGAHLPDRVGDVEVKVDEISRANVLVLDTMNQQMLERFNASTASI